MCAVRDLMAMRTHKVRMPRVPRCRIPSRGNSSTIQSVSEAVKQTQPVSVRTKSALCTSLSEDHQASVRLCQTRNQSSRQLPQSKPDSSNVSHTPSLQSISGST